MTLTRRQIAVGMVLLLVFAIGVVFLVRLGMAASSNAGVPLSASTDATPPTGDNDSTGADGPGTGEGGHPEPGTDNGSTGADGPGTGGAGGRPEPGTGSSPTSVGSPGVGGESGHLNPGTDSSPTSADSTWIDNRRPQPPPPAVMLSDSEWLYIPIFSGDGDPVVLKEGEVGRVGIFQGFSVVAPAKVVDVSISTYEPGEILVPDHPAPGEDGRECRRGVTAEPAGEGSYLCTLGVRMSEAAKPGVRYEGKVTLTFRATCTAKTGYPCEKLPDHYAPSPDNPIDVTFIAEGPLIFEKEKQV